MFEINDIILYGNDGVCTLTDIVSKDINGKQADYYALCPVYDGSATIFVPIDNEKLTSRMRKVISKDEINKLIRSMPEEETIWIENESERKEKYKAIIAAGDRKKLVQIIKTLYLHQNNQKAKGRKLHLCDERFLKDAEKILYDEFALVLGIERSQVLPFIMQQVDLAQK